MEKHFAGKWRAAPGTLAGQPGLAAALLSIGLAEARVPARRRLAMAV